MVFRSSMSLVHILRSSVLRNYGVRFKHTLPPLPYDTSALEPVISKEIMQLHHSKHHAAYVNNLNIAEEQFADAMSKSDVTKMISLQVSLHLSNNFAFSKSHSLFLLKLLQKIKVENCKQWIMLVKNRSS
uniref:superoxide dismutase n=1 Tax=Schistosoma japonicum TaxID=6182 RepID=Q5DGW3_SCHJA|nr:SJCHGC03207 protein [Schistosoma japonicum]